MRKRLLRRLFFLMWLVLFFLFLIVVFQLRVRGNGGLLALVWKKLSMAEFLSLYQYDCISKEKNEKLSESETLLLNIFTNQINNGGDGTSLIVFHPRGRSGLGNNLWRLMNTLVLGLITKSTIFVHPSLGFYDPVHFPFFSFFRPKNGKLCELMQYPPKNKHLRKFLSYQSKSLIWDEAEINKLRKSFRDNTMGEGDSNDDTTEVDLWEYMLDREKNVVFFDDITIFELTTNEEKDPSTYHSLLPYTDCHGFVCHNFIESDDPMDLSSLYFTHGNLFQLHDWVNGWYGHHVFKSERNRNLFCEVLKLCEGMDLNRMSKNHPVTGYRYEGFVLLGRLFSSIFDFNYYELGRVFEKTLEKVYKNNQGKTVLVSIQLRTHYVGKDIRPFLNCVEKVVKYIQLEEKGENIEEIKFYVASDDQDVKRKLSEQIEYYNEINNGNVRITSFVVDEGSVDQDDLMNNWKDFEIKKQMMLDLFLMKNSDYNILTQSSTFGFWGTMLNPHFTSMKRKPFVIPTNIVMKMDVTGYQKKRYYPGEEDLGSCYLMDEPPGRISMQFTTEQYL